MNERSWSIAGAAGEPIIGDSLIPDDPRGHFIIAHGFKGYKDYGMFPRIARSLAEAGFAAHRFNFSHSGMTNTFDTFERPELFEQDTWNKQVFDLTAVLRAVASGEFGDGGLPVVVFGHSRGGATALLTLGRHADDADFPHPAGLITAAAPSSTCRMSPETRDLLLANGFLDSPSSRTGQALRVGRVWLDEQRDDPDGHDLLALAARITAPALVIHGEDDPTVPATDAAEIANALPNAETLLISAANHVFNTPNPFPADGEPGEALRTLVDGSVHFATRVM